ncbi:hypothetical protein SCHPADRAFT_719738 [Schizopora paradoxa]|uniref:Uncharacterized protein n=1 Tax=Schizopora paradoxa TaxID=27342 RepID=A0A0H2R1J6_9AGAM|nr:hypothetical protein SCHPADRAFT_719738 [Schizopora paradoxa]
MGSLGLSQHEIRLDRHFKISPILNSTPLGTAFEDTVHADVVHSPSIARLVSQSHHDHAVEAPFVQNSLPDSPKIINPNSSHDFDLDGYGAENTVEFSRCDNPSTIHLLDSHAEANDKNVKMATKLSPSAFPLDLAAGVNLPWYDPFLEYMYFRFGFTYPPEGPSYPNLGKWKGDISKAKLSALRKEMLDEYTALEAPAELRRHLFHFVKFLGYNGNPPASLWDLNPKNDRHLVSSRAMAMVEMVDLGKTGDTKGTRRIYRLLAGRSLTKWALYPPFSFVAELRLR